jgi:hypothetical protein
MQGVVLTDNFAAQISRISILDRRNNGVIPKLVLDGDWCLGHHLHSKVIIFILQINRHVDAVLINLLNVNVPLLFIRLFLHFFSERIENTSLSEVLL